MRIAILALLLTTTAALAQTAPPPGKMVSWKELQQLFVSGEQPTRPDAFGDSEQTLEFLLCVAVDGKVSEVRALSEAPASELDPMLATLRTWRYSPPREPLCAKLSWTFHAPVRPAKLPPPGAAPHVVSLPRAISRPTPRRPDEFRGKAQTLVFKVCVNSDGSVRTVDPVGAMADKERDALAATLRTWKFERSEIAICGPVRLDYDK